MSTPLRIELPERHQWKKALTELVNEVQKELKANRALAAPYRRRVVNDWIMETKNAFGLWDDEPLLDDIGNEGDFEYVKKHLEFSARAVRKATFAKGFEGRGPTTPTSILEGMRARQKYRRELSVQLMSLISEVLKTGEKKKIEQEVLDAWSKEALKVFGLRSELVHEVQSESDVVALSIDFRELKKAMNTGKLAIDQEGNLAAKYWPTTWLARLARAHRGSYVRKRQHSPPHSSFVPDNRDGTTDVGVVKKRR